MKIFEEEKLKSTKILDPAQAKNPITDHRLYTFFDQLTFPKEVESLTGVYLTFQNDSISQKIYKHLSKKIDEKVINFVKKHINFEYVELIELAPCCYFLVISNQDDTVVVEKLIDLKHDVEKKTITYKETNYKVFLKCGLYFTTPYDDAYTFFQKSKEQHAHTQNKETFLSSYDSEFDSIKPYKKHNPFEPNE